MKLSPEPRPCLPPPDPTPPSTMTHVLLSSTQAPGESTPHPHTERCPAQVSCQLAGGPTCTCHSTVHGGYVRLPKPGHAVPPPRPSPSVPEATTPPGTPGFQAAGGGSRRAWLHLGSHLVSVLLPESLENQKCTAWDGLFLRAGRSRRAHGWLLEKAFHRPCSSRTVFSARPPGSAGGRGLSLLLGPRTSAYVSPFFVEDRWAQLPGGF